MQSIAGPERRSRRWWLFIIALVLTIGAYFGLRSFQDNSAYEAGLTAYQQGDCDAALENWRRINLSDSWLRSQEVVSALQSQRLDCDNFVRARENPVPGDAVVSFHWIADNAGPLSALAQERLTALYRDTPPDVLANTPDFCAMVLRAPDNPPDELLDTLLLRCARTYQSADLPARVLCNPPAGVEFNPFLITNAICPEAEQVANRSLATSEFLTLFLARFPDHPDRSEAEALLVDELNRQADAFAAGEIPQPQSVGRHRGDTALLTIQNDALSTAPLRLTLDEAYYEVPPCLTCEEFFGDGPETCPDVGPVETFEVPAGAYRITVSTTSGGVVTPFRGTWNLEAGVEYFSCFFIVRSAFGS